MVRTLTGYIASTASRVPMVSGWRPSPLQAAAHAMIASGTAGRIINVASEAAVQTFRYLGAYAASKFAVVGLTQAAALELGAFGITVNAIGPGTTETDMVLAERRSESDVGRR